jgi:hypothetical protein
MRLLVELSYSQDYKGLLYLGFGHARPLRGRNYSLPEVCVVNRPDLI